MKKSTLYGLSLASFIFAGISNYLKGVSTLTFVLSGVAVGILALFLGKATEDVAHYSGERIGAFISASFGNAAELIIAILLLREGLFDMLKASITGSIMGNLLLVLGLSVLVGGIKYKEQTFNELLASHNASLMLLAIIALFVPAMFQNHMSATKLEPFSLIVAVLLILVYLLWLFFSMHTHKHHLSSVQVEEELHEPLWGKKQAIFMLFFATILVAIDSEWLVKSVEHVAHQFHLSNLFLGGFILALVGNAAEHFAAILLARKNKIGASVEIAVGSSLQIALFVTPILILIGYFIHQELSIIFTVPELVAIGVSVFIAKSISEDGHTTWFEGLLLLLVYILIGTGFYFIH